MIITRKRITVASLIVGGIGALIGGLLAGNWTELIHATLPTGIITGFLSCFFVSKWYLNFMEYRGPGRGILFGSLFGGLAGAISGLITGVVLGFAAMSMLQAGYVRNLLGNPLNSGMYGLVSGGLIGLAIGFISSLIFWAIRTVSEVGSNSKPKNAN
jgi:hypothetical protein